MDYIARCTLISCRTRAQNWPGPRRVKKNRTRPHIWLVRMASVPGETETEWSARRACRAEPPTRRRTHTMFAHGVKYTIHHRTYIPYSLLSSYIRLRNLWSLNTYYRFIGGHWNPYSSVFTDVALSWPVFSNMIFAKHPFLKSTFLFKA
jgi:hypothetical protein